MYSPDMFFKISSKAGSRNLKILVFLLVSLISGLIVMPRINQANALSVVHKEIELDKALRTVRNAIELYHYTHNQTYPGTLRVDNSIAVCKGSECFWTLQLTSWTNENGQTALGGKSEEFPIPPILEELPSNPFAAKSKARIISGTFLTQNPLKFSGDPTIHWLYNPITGQFIANTPKHEGW